MHRFGVAESVATETLGKDAEMDRGELLLFQVSDLLLQWIASGNAFDETSWRRWVFDRGIVAEVARIFGLNVLECSHSRAWRKDIVGFVDRETTGIPLGPRSSSLGCGPPRGAWLPEY